MMMPEPAAVGPLSLEKVERLVFLLYGLMTTACHLPGEYDHNYRLKTSKGSAFVLKMMHPMREVSFVEMQCRAFQHLDAAASSLVLPRVIPTLRGELFTHLRADDGSGRLVWMLTYVPGTTLAETSPPRPSELLATVGRVLAEVDSALLTFSHPLTERDLKWDLSRALWAREYLPQVSDPSARVLADHFLTIFEREVLPRSARLRRSVIYGDANDHNIILHPRSDEESPSVSLIDFGDIHRGFTVAEPAVAAAYAVLSEDEPLRVASAVLAGYQRVFPLNQDETAVFFPLIAARLAVSAVNSAVRKSLLPGDPYVTVSEEAVWKALQRLSEISCEDAHACFREIVNQVLLEGEGPESSKLDVSVPRFPFEELVAARKRLLGRNLSLSYDKPLNIVRGFMQHLYDETGREYLDVYNNVPLVGHSHPRLVRSIQEQVAVLNTNTRYLHANVLRYAERLVNLLPEPLRVCYFVNSGSEANELALRMARTHTKREDVIVLEHAYHGNTGTLIDISPHKFKGSGGTGCKPWVHVAPIADDYRGLYRRGEPNLSKKYCCHVREILENCTCQDKPVAAFLAETLPSVAGQIVFPLGYLQEVYRHVRAAGGVCIADEVQVGFGRLGTHFWGFETQDVVPDILVLGKPIGNGFPLAAVVATPEIADSFANGMEFFSTFGGNPVGCAAGLAVLDVLREEKLQENALAVGRYWIAALKELQGSSPLIGDVRGCGLFLGIDLISDERSRTPATAQASYVVNRLRDCGILAGTDGPHNNVIKLRPPLIFSKSDADLFTSTFAAILQEDAAQPD